LTLLLAGVAWPRTLLPAPVVFYTTFSPLLPQHGGSGLFLWPDPAAYAAPEVIRRHALWSADFPRSHGIAWDRDRPASLDFYLTIKSLARLDKAHRFM